MLFSVGIQFINKDIHTFNINALSFKHANLKLERYEFLNIGKNIKRSNIACSVSGYFNSDLPLVKISKNKLTGYPIVTTHNNEKYNIL
jgi:hypothetical protein